MRSEVRGLLWLASVACFVGGLGAQENVHLILHNAKVLTVDDDFTVAEAVAVAGNRISAVGRSEDILKLAGPRTTIIDLKGRTVIPGLVDTHTHLHDYAESAYGGALTPDQRASYAIEWRGVRSKQDVLNQIRGIIEKYRFPKGQWVYFVNQLQFTGDSTVDQAKILYDELDRWELDKVAPDHPIALSLGIPDVSGVLVNSKGVEVLWKQYRKFIEHYGRYWLKNGEPDGHLEPPASRIVLKLLPRPSPDVLAPLYRNYIDEMLAAGVTTVSTRLPSEAVAAFRQLDSRGELRLRIGYGMQEEFGTITPDAESFKNLRGVVGSGTDTIWVTSVTPTAVDGASTRACTSLTRKEAYGAIDRWWPKGQCHMDVEFNGAQGKAARLSGNYFKEWVNASAREGVRLANTHVAGDRSISLLLDSIADIQRRLGPDATRGWAFDHCTLVNPADFPRAAKLGVTLSCAPKYIENVGPVAAGVYGDKVAHSFVVPAKSMLDAGIRVVFETDRDGYAWHDLSLLLTRRDKKGNVWGPQEKLDRTRALRMATNWAADYVLKGNEVGSIQPRRLADLVVLDRDYMTIPDEEVEHIRPVLTIVDGKIVYLHPVFAAEQNLRAPGAVVATYEELVARRTSKLRSDQ